MLKEKKKKIYSHFDIIFFFVVFHSIYSPRYSSSAELLLLIPSFFIHCRPIMLFLLAIREDYVEILILELIYCNFII